MLLVTAVFEASLILNTCPLIGVAGNVIVEEPPEDITNITYELPVVKSVLPVTTDIA